MESRVLRHSLEMISFDEFELHLQHLFRAQPSVNVEELEKLEPLHQRLPALFEAGND